MTLHSYRAPTEARPSRMAKLARLPVFLALTGRRAIVAGNTAAAAWKAKLLSAAGAKVEVYAPDPDDELLMLSAGAASSSIILHRRNWTASDFAGAAIAVGACDDDAQAQYFAEAARAAGVPVNVIDKPRFCDFAFGAIVNRSPLVIGISTDGAAPVFGQAIRAKLEALIPRGFARWAEAARLWRGDVQSSGLSFNARRRFWQLFTERAVTNPGRDPQSSDFDRLLADAKADSPRVERGSVTLVGAGPGDPELLTLRAVRALQSADVILFDDLVSPEVLEFSRREAKKMLVGKTGHGPSCKQSEINQLMIGLAKSGRRVVRLKGGDPMIFGRAGEEIAACRRARIAVEVVPGITAAQGAASRLGVSLTQRGTARRVQFITGHGADGALPGDIDWRSLADPSVTTVIYMPVKTLRVLASRACEAGLDPATPAVAVARATRPDEAWLVGTVADLPDHLDAASLPGPVTVMIGRAYENLPAGLTQHPSEQPAQPAA
ncbi:MAG: uroporphyrinogen-III C-methyltransferase [Rhizobiales bacterium]|jgi:uroporphyrin-III C-methyltransferase/precorrin-2 dehydrogenase/sirohydrochlorin ferrochelatase|nr:uroporphyrinogen-III C-methyltransferase [Hyphomicrobiales bacterium]